MRDYGPDVCMVCKKNYRKGAPNSKRCRLCSLKSQGRPDLGVSDRECIRCHVPYTPTNGSQKYCSTCAPIIDRERKNRSARSIRKRGGSTCVGDILICLDCDAQFIYKRGIQKRCEPCQAQAKLRLSLEHTNSKRWWRKSALERDGYTCQKCGHYGDQVHHLNGKGLNVPTEERDHSSKNLTTLCKKCHRQIHNAVYRTLFNRHMDEVAQICKDFIHSN